MNKKKRQIIHAARTLFIEHGYADTSIADIITLANVSKGTFYNHFSSKTSCLVAILEETREHSINERYRVAINKEPNDINVLIDQISQIILANHKHNTFEIFTTNLGKADQEVIDVLEKHTMLEVDWLAHRLIDIYGEKVREISYECSTQVFGMIIFTFRVLMITNKQQFIAPERVVKTVLGHTDAIIQQLIKTKDILITPNVFKGFQDDLQKDMISKMMLVEQLQKFNEKLTDKDSENGVELTTFLIEELQRPDERLHVLESIIYFFSKSFENTQYQAEVNEISSAFWQYLELKNN